MPSSRPFILYYLAQQILEFQPKTILDIGIGSGKNGFIAREYTDVWHGNMFNRKTRIDGIEIYQPYISDIQRRVYDNIYIGDAVEILPELENYEFMIMIDVLEHLPGNRGLKLLEDIKQKCDNALITTPLSVKVQGAVYDNKYERHITQWDGDILGKFGKVTVLTDLNCFLVNIGDREFV